MILSLGTTALAAETPIESINDYEEIQSAVSKIKSQYFEEYEALSPEEKDARLKYISNLYLTPGEILNESDSAFILLSMWEEKNTLQPTAGFSSKWYDVYKTQYGVKVNLYGTMKQDICYAAGNSHYGGTALAEILSGSIRRVDLAIHHTAYGMIGANAPYVGILYNGKVSMTKYGNNKITKMDKMTDYSSVLPVYTTMYASGVINTSAGDEFTVTSNTWTSWQ